MELDEMCGGVRCVVELDDYTFNMHMWDILLFMACTPYIDKTNCL